MNSAMIAPATSASYLDRLAQLVPILVKTSLLGLVVFVAQTLVIVAFPVGALGYGCYRLVRRSGMEAPRDL